MPEPLCESFNHSSWDAIRAIVIIIRISGDDDAGGFINGYVASIIIIIFNRRGRQRNETRARLGIHSTSHFSEGLSREVGYVLDHARVAM